MAFRQLLTAAMLCALLGPASAASREPVVTQMGNGLTVVLQRDTAADLVAADVWVRAGSGRETPANNGISHLIEHLVFAATATREPGDVDREIESVGATLSAHTSRDWAHFSTTVSSRYLSRALDLLADVVSSAQFRQVDLERERSVIIDEIGTKQANPISFCHDMLARELYGSHPYALPIEGSTESIRKITRDDILAYYSSHFVAPNMAVVLVGNIDAQQALELVGKAFQRLPMTPAPELAAVAAVRPTKQVSRSVKAPFKFDYLAIGFLGPAASDLTDVCAMDALLTYFGFGYRSWMSTELKGNLGLAVDVSSDFLTQRDPAMISLIAGVTPGNLDKARGAIFARLAAVRAHGIGEQELELAKRSLLGQYAFQNETYAGQANTRGFYFALGDPTIATRYVDVVRGITAGDVARVAQKYLDPDAAVVLTVGPEQGDVR